MSDEILTTSGGSSALLRGLLIAAPFFLFLYYAQVSSQKIKELKDKLSSTTPPTENGANQNPQVTIQQDTALINQNNNLIYENKILEERVDSVLKLVVVTTIPAAVDNGNTKMFEDSFNIYKGYYITIQDQLTKCRNEKGNLRMEMKNYVPKNPGVTY